MQGGGTNGPEAPREREMSPISASGAPAGTPSVDPDLVRLRELLALSGLGLRVGGEERYLGSPLGTEPEQVRLPEATDSPDGEDLVLLVPGPLSPRDREIAQLFLSQLAARRRQEEASAHLRRKVAQLTSLTGLASLVTSNLDLGEVKANAIHAAAKLMEAEAASLLLLDERSSELYFDVALGEKQDEVQRIRLGADEGIAGWVVQNDEAVLIDEVASDPRHSPRVDEEVGFSTRELLAVPLRSSGRVLGCLQVLNSLDGSGFLAEEVPVFQAFADQVAVAVENARLYQELQRTKDLVERQQEALVQAEKLSAMGQLSAGVAQEIRSPISAISGYAQLIRRRRPEEKILKPVQVIEEAASRINRVVNGLIDFASKEEPVFEPVDVEEVLEHSIDLARETLRRYPGVEIQREFHGDLPRVSADRRHLQQVFQNLLLNAVEATAKGGRITLRTFGEPYAGDEGGERIGRVVILFQDQGSGISEDDQGRVFQPFFTTSREGGTGLGLSICRSIVQQHRGAITFETEEGEGTTFRVHLPVER